MESREQRIATLAATLKTSGIAKSDAQAKMMAEDMVGVEEHVQKDYEEKHAAAHEYLQTAKNLGAPRQKVKTEAVIAPKSGVRLEGSRMIEPLPTGGPEKTSAGRMTAVPNSDLPPAHTDIQFSGKTLNQAFDHNTHNAALEAIKAQISSGPSNIAADDADDIDSVGPEDSQDSHDADTHSTQNGVKKEFLMKDVDDILEAPELPKGFGEKDMPVTADVKEISEMDSEIASDLDNGAGVAVDEKVRDASIHDAVTSDDLEGTPAEMIDSVEAAETVETVPDEHPKLDAQKLVELMEEDGKLEEHTREIKEKPTNVKPKEAYEENNIDLSSVFNFHKK